MTGEQSSSPEGPTVSQQFIDLVRAHALPIEGRPGITHTADWGVEPPITMEYFEIAVDEVCFSEHTVTTDDGTLLDATAFSIIMKARKKPVAIMLHDPTGPLPYQLGTFKDRSALDELPEKAIAELLEIFQRLEQEKRFTLLKGKPPNSGL
jgi:hypothetical protein